MAAFIVRGRSSGITIDTDIILFSQRLEPDTNHNMLQLTHLKAGAQKWIVFGPENLISKINEINTRTLIFISRNLDRNYKNNAPYKKCEELPYKTCS